MSEIDDNDMELDSLFESDGDLQVPTMRGDANLDVEDYEGPDRSSILDDEIQEDTPSTPGSGAGPATDVEGIERLDMLAVQGGPGMQQTTFGSSPWGPGGGQGYRPYAQMRTDMELGNDEPTTVKVAPHDDMLDELRYTPGSAALIVPGRRNLQDNIEPSNDEVDPQTLYDRISYELDQDSQNVIGNGIFDMEEGVTWRGEDGVFQHQYALPAYIAHEGEIDVQQSEMWDATAENWRVTQPSAGGVTLARGVKTLKPPPNASKIEHFGWTTAQALVGESRRYRGSARSRFLENAMNALGPGMSARCRKIADRLIALGMQPEKALTSVVAHCVMHATLDDLLKNKARTPRLNNLAAAAPQTGAVMRQAAQETIVPASSSQAALNTDIAKLKASPSAMQGLGQVAQDAASVPVPGASATSATLFTPKNLLIAGAVAGGGYLLWRNRKAIAKNARKLGRKLGI